MDAILVTTVESRYLEIAEPVLLETKTTQSQPRISSQKSKTLIHHRSLRFPAAATTLGTIQKIDIRHV